MATLDVRNDTDVPEAAVPSSGLVLYLEGAVNAEDLKKGPLPTLCFTAVDSAGGTMTELMQDTVSLVLPASDSEIQTALMSLRIAPLLDGYRGAPAADIATILAAIRALQDFTIAHADRLVEIEINPLICTASRAQ